MFQGAVTLRGQEATVVHVYQTAAVCKTWTVYRSEQGAWTLRAEVTRADPFRLRQGPLLFRAPRVGGYFQWPIVAATLEHPRSLTASLGPPIS
jgi:hypothetical protein